jgi:hypothetical protein
MEHCFTSTPAHEVGAKRHHLGSTRMVTKADGTLDASQVSYAYGRFRGGVPTLPTDHQFTGQQVDANGLVF